MEAHEKHKQELDELIITVVSRAVEAAVGRLVPSAIHKALGTVVNDMQAYTDRAEADLRKSISEIRVALLVSPSVPPTQIRSSGSRGEPWRPAPMGTARQRLHAGREMGLNPISRAGPEISGAQGKTRTGAPYILP